MKNEDSPEDFFEEEEEFADLTTDISQNLDSMRTSTDQFFKKKLILFCIRWTITLVLLYVFMESYPWVKYLVYAAIPLGILNLVLIFWGRKKINEKLSNTEDKMKSL